MKLNTLIFVSVFAAVGCGSNNDNAPLHDGNTTTVEGSSSMDEDAPIQNTIMVIFDITVPAFQSNELRVELVWRDINYSANWVGDEYWSVHSELPSETEDLLTVTFYDFNGDIELARVSREFKTGSKATETLQISADQFDADQFDADDDGVNNLDELIAGSDPLIDEDATLAIFDYYPLSSIFTSRMSVSRSFESRLSKERPFFETYEPNPEWTGFPGTISGNVDIDQEGNGTLDYNYFANGVSLNLTGIRTNSGSSITWEGNRRAHEDYVHSVNFVNTVTVLSKDTRGFVEEIAGSNIGTYAYQWEISSNLTGKILEGTSLCEPVAGTVSITEQSNEQGNTITEDSDTVVTTIDKEIDDQYWRVVIVNENTETTEYFVRRLIIDRPVGSSASTFYPEDDNFICDFVDIKSSSFDLMLSDQ